MALPTRSTTIPRSMTILISFAIQIMPLTFRAKGVSLSTATNWAFNTLVGEITPYLQEKIEWRLYFMHSIFCALSFFLGSFFPARSLEDSHRY